MAGGGLIMPTSLNIIGSVPILISLNGVIVPTVTGVNVAVVGSVGMKISSPGVIALATPSVLAITGSVNIAVAPKGVIAFVVPSALEVVGSVRVRVRPTGIISEAGPNIRACIGSVKLKISTHGVIGGLLPISPPVLSVIGSVRIGIGVPGAVTLVVPSTLAVIGSVKICVGEFRVPELTVVQLLSPADMALAAITGSVGIGIGSAGVITLSTPPVYAVPPPQVVQEATIQIRVAGVIAFISPQILEVIGDIEVGIGGGPVDPGIFETYVLTGARGEPSLYSGFNFNSYAKYRGQYFGAGMDGVYLLEGEDDAGDDIHPGIRIGPINFGTDREKRLRLLRCGGKTKGATVKVSNGNGSAGHYDVVGGRAAISREVQGRELVVEISDFETLDHMEIVPLVLHKR